MKITDVEAFYLSLPEIQPRTDSSQDALLVRVSTDAGITGWSSMMGSGGAPNSACDTCTPP